MVIKRPHVKSWPVITVHVEPSDKAALEAEARSKGMQLATYCRMLLLDSLKRG